MICPKCGVTLPDGTKFCGSCGTRLTASQDVPQNIVKAPQKVPVPTRTVETETVRPDMGAAARKHPNVKLFAVIAVILVVLLAGGFLLFGGKSGSGKNAVVMLQDERYELLTNLKKGKLTDVGAAKSDFYDESMVRFSPDGKYFYYLTKYDGWTGTLCRAEYAKLKEGSSKNDQYLTTIASNVRAGFWMLKDGSLLYKNDDSTLYYYNGKDSTQVAKDVYNVYQKDDNENEILYTREKDGDDTDLDLYYVALNKKDDPTKIDGHVSYVYLTTDFNDILYSKTNDDGELNLYHAGISKEPEKLASDVGLTYAVRKAGQLFYFEYSGKTLSLYDMVNDPYKVTTEPSWSDYYRDGQYDDDGYSKAWTHYSMRESLMSEDNDIKLYNLYSYEKGKATLVAEGVVGINTLSGGFAYWTKDALTGEMDIDDLEYAYDAYWGVTNLEGTAVEDIVDPTKIKLYNKTTGAFSELTAEAYEDFDKFYSGFACVLKDTVFLTDDDELLVASIKDGKVGAFKFVAEDAEFLWNDGETAYYTADSYDRDGYTYADLYRYAKGESTRVAQDILDARVAVYEDGNTYVYTDASSRGVELTCIGKDANRTVVADDVQQYIRMDKNNLLYIQDGELYSYNGKEKTRIASDITHFWVASPMKAEASFGTND